MPVVIGISFALSATSIVLTIMAYALGLTPLIYFASMGLAVVGLVLAAAQ